MSEVIEWTKSSLGFGTPGPNDDFYHGASLPEKHHEMTETWYWGFNEPVSGLHGFIHIWTHPNLGICTAGIFAHIGSKRDQLACEVFDFRNFAPDTIFNAAGDITLANGLTVDFEIPMQRMRIRYENKDRDFALDMVQDAVQPAIMRSNDAHFEQTMRTVGSVTFEGKVYSFDNLTIRDRSWGERRPEVGHKMPPYTWMNGAFSEDFAFCISGLDDPDRNPDWAGLYDVPSEQLMSDAWVYLGGKKFRLSRFSKITERARDCGLRPVRHVIDCTLEDGRDLQFVGEVVGSVPWHCWQNALCHTGLTRWTCTQTGETCWGETQEVQWNDYVYRLCSTV